MGLPKRECTELLFIIVKGSPGNSHTSAVKNHCIKAKYRVCDLVKEQMLSTRDFHH